MFFIVQTIFKFNNHINNVSKRKIPNRFQKINIGTSNFRFSLIIGTVIYFYCMFESNSSWIDKLIVLQEKLC